MTTELSQYLDSVRANLRLDLSTEREILRELETHIEDELQELKESGIFRFYLHLVDSLFIMRVCPNIRATIMATGWRNIGSSLL